MFAAAAQGLATGQARFAAASERAIATLDPAAIVDQKLAEAQLLASAKVVRVADALTGTLIDTLA